MTVRGHRLPPWVLDRLPAMLSAVCVALLGLLLWLGRDAHARLGELEHRASRYEADISAVRATATGDSARLARIEALLDARLPIPRLDMSPPGSSR